MKIIHAADLHLEGGYNKLTPEKNRLMREEGLLVFSQLIDVAVSEKAAIVLIAGDLFDKLSVRVSTKKFVLQAIESHPEIEFFYCLGNHDHRLSFENHPKNLHIFSVEFEKFDLGEVVIGGSSVLKFSRRDLVQKINFDAEKINILMLHAQIFSAGKEDCLSFDVKDLSGKNIDYLALGHVHSRLNGKIDDRGEWVYSGNGGQRGFGQDKRGYVVIDISNNKISWQRHNFNLPRQFVELNVDISSADSYNDIKALIINQLKNINKDDLVRVNLIGECDETLEKQGELLIREVGKEFFHFEIVDSTKLKIDIESLKKESLSLKAEIINLIYASELSDDQKDDCAKIAVRALRGEEVDV